MTKKIREWRAHARQREDETWITGYGEIVPVSRMANDHLVSLAVNFENAEHTALVKRLNEQFGGPGRSKEERLRISARLTELCDETFTFDAKVNADRVARVSAAIPKYRTLRRELEKRGLVRPGETVHAAQRRLAKAEMRAQQLAREGR